MTISKGIRNRILTDYVDLIPGEIKKGLGRLSAGAIYGICETTMYTWIRKGKEDMQTNNRATNLYGKLYQAIIIAEAEWELERLNKLHIDQVDANDMKSNQWLLERRLRRKWGANASEKDGEESTEDKSSLSALSISELQKIVSDASNE
jgi:hypothetical protein